jgi:hypothetical protein
MGIVINELFLFRDHLNLERRSTNSGIEIWGFEHPS